MLQDARLLDLMQYRSRIIKDPEAEEPFRLGSLPTPQITRHVLYSRFYGRTTHANIGEMGRGKKLISLLGQRLQQQLGNVVAVGPSSAKGREQIASQVVFHQGQQTRAAAAQAATAVATKQQTAASTLPSSIVPAVSTDIFGAISAITEGSKFEEGVFKNVDGHRCVVVALPCGPTTKSQRHIHDG